MNKKLTTQKFLELLWGDVVPSYGYVMTEPQPPRKQWSTIDVSVQTLGNAAALTARLNDDSSVKGVFYMPAILSQPFVKNPTKRSLRTNNDRNNRFKRGFRALFVDMDCGVGKPHANATEALRSVKPFLDATGLPPYNVVVASGNGVHLYWVTNKVMPLNTWLPMAKRLKALCKKHGLKADPSVTADVARVLRLPGTLNRKDANTAKPCNAIQVGPLLAPERLTAALGAEPAQQPTNLASALSGQTSDDLRGSVGGKPAFMKNVVGQCKYFGDVAATGGAWCSDTVWMLVLLACTFTKDGEEWAHKLSNKHKGYSPAGTDAKYRARIDARAAQPTLGATRCATLEADDNSGRNLCDGCEHKGNITSPVQLGRDVIATSAPPDKLLLPKGYTRNSDGSIWLTTMGRDGEPKDVPIAGGIPIQRLEIMYTAAEDDEGQATLHFTAGRARSVTLRISDYQLQTLPVAMSKQGFDLVSSRDFTLFKEFIVAWITKLKAAGVTSHGSVRFGWPEHLPKGSAEYSNFNLGGISYKKDGTKLSSAASITTSDTTYTVRGSRTKWDDAVKLLLSADQPGLTTILAASFAAPLMKLANVTGAGISVWSSASGIGKTSAMKVAQAVWGDPSAGITSLNDTAMAIITKAGDINNLPMFWDEVRTSAVLETVGATLFSIIQGRDKVRCDRSGKRRETVPFNTLLVTTSNSSLLGTIEEAAGSSTAGNARLLEIFIQQPSNVPVGGDSLFGALTQNHGHAGVIYVEYLVKNQVAIRKAVEATGNMIRVKSGATNEERFWINTMAALLVGASLAKKLKLVDFDVLQLQRFYFSLLTMTRIETDTFKDTITATHILGDLLYALSTRTFTTDVFRSAGNAQVDPTIVSLPASPHHPVAVHRQSKNGAIRIVKTALREELARGYKKYGFTVKEFTRALEREGVYVASVQRRFPQCHGSIIQWSKVWVLEVNTRGRGISVSSSATEGDINEHGETDDE